MLKDPIFCATFITLIKFHWTLLHKWNVWVNIQYNTIFFTFQAQSLSLSFLPCAGSHSKQPAGFSFRIYSYPRFSFTLFQGVRNFPLFAFPFQDIFLIRFFIHIPPCVKALVLINKQFSLNSFHDWEGYLWDLSLSRSSISAHTFLSFLQLLLTHLTR